MRLGDDVAQMVASRIGGSGLLVFCQMGQGCGGKGSEFYLRSKKEGKQEDMCLVCVQSTVYYLENV